MAAGGGAGLLERTMRGEFIQPPADDESLYEALERQLDTLGLPPDADRTARYIIGNIDANGYLRRSPQAMATDMLLGEDFEPTPEVMEQALEAVRSLDPPGVGAESLRQSMELQLRRMAPSTERDDALRIVERHFDRLAARRFSQLRPDAGDDPTRLERALALLRRLNPKPGAAFGGERAEATYVEPDFLVDVGGDDIRVSLAGSIPELALSQSFAQAVRDMDRRRGAGRDPYVVQRFNDAREYLRILERRQQTLMDVMTAIVDLQRPYFLSLGDEALLRPMGLKDVAARSGLDVSVISRATKNKYAQMPWATVPLRFFFSEGFSSGNEGTVVSGRGVEQAIRKAVEGEDKRRPLSDEAICKILRADGYDVSRRTVSKYRDRSGHPGGPPEGDEIRNMERKNAGAPGCVHASDKEHSYDSRGRTFGVRPLLFSRTGLDWRWNRRVADRVSVAGVLLHYHAGVVSAEAESVAHGGAHGAALGLVEGEVEVVVDLGIEVLGVVVDRRGDDVLVDGLDGENGLECSGGAEQVAGHGLGGAEVQLVGVVAEDFVYGLLLAAVADGRGGAVQVDVVDVLGPETCVAQGVLHDEDGSEPFGVRGGDVVCVGAHAAAHYFGVDLGSARLGVLKLFEHERGGTLADNEPVLASRRRGGMLPWGRRCGWRGRAWS